MPCDLSVRAGTVRGRMSHHYYPYILLRGITARTALTSHRFRFPATRLLRSAVHFFVQVQYDRFYKMMLLEWIAVASGLWLGATRVRDSRVAGLLAVLVTAHLGLMMLLGNPRPNEILVLDSRRSRQSFSKSAYYDAGAPVAIIILFLRLFNPQFFEGKLSKWWPLAVILVSAYSRETDWYSWLTSCSYPADLFCSSVVSRSTSMIVSSLQHISSFFSHFVRCYGF